MGHNCLWRSHAYSLGSASSQSGALFWQGEAFFGRGSLFRKFQGTAAEPPRLSWQGAFQRGRHIMVDQEVIDSQLKADRFPFQSEGDITLRVRNANYTLGPVMLHIGMNPGAVIPAHL